jgi:Predicted flavoprotein
MPKILAFSGSARLESWNKKLISYSASVLRSHGATVTLIDLRDFPMPIYDGDIESGSGIPENGLKLKALMMEHQGILISSPEYNSEIPPLVKNTIDWISRREPGDASRLIAFRGKVAAVMSASPGMLGGPRVRTSLRGLLSYMGMILLPEQFGLSFASKAFSEDGMLKEDSNQEMVNDMMMAMVRLVDRFG